MKRVLLGVLLALVTACTLNNSPSYYEGIVIKTDNDSPGSVVVYVTTRVFRVAQVPPMVQDRNVYVSRNYVEDGYLQVSLANANGETIALDPVVVNTGDWCFDLRVDAQLRFSTIDPCKK